VAGSCECGDESSGSSAKDLVNILQWLHKTLQEFNKEIIGLL
jgi:hypothetical protein